MGPGSYSPFIWQDGEPGFSSHFPALSWLLRILPASPGIDDAAPARGSGFRRGAQAPEDPRARVGGIDDRVDLEQRGHVERLATLVGHRDHGLERLLAGDG